MTKTELEALITKKTGLKATTVREVTEATFKIIAENLKHGEPTQIDGFGVFKYRVHAARRYFNVTTRKFQESPDIYRPFLEFNADLKTDIKKGINKK